MDNRSEVFETLAKEIRTAMDEGARQLENIGVRVEVNYLIKYGGLKQNPEDFDAWELMNGLAAGVIQVWPNCVQLSAYEGVERKLLPLRKIREALKANEIDQWVVISDGAYINDPRMQLDKFKKKLWDTVLKACP